MSEVKKTEEVKEEVKTEQPVETAKAAAPAAAEKKETLVDKLKKHWKGVTAASLGVLAIGLSARAAYKRGKAAQVEYPAPEEEDYTLNPNN